MFWIKLRKEQGELTRPNHHEWSSHAHPRIRYGAGSARRNYTRTQAVRADVPSQDMDEIQVLLVGAVLATHRRTVTSALRVMGLSDDKGFARYHHVLNRAEWSPLQLSRVLLSLLEQRQLLLLAYCLTG